MSERADPNLSPCADAPEGASSRDAQSRGPRKIDLHCHSDASNKTSEVALNAIKCPESYSHPDDVYTQARRRGMDFVTITDHDSIEGVLRIAHKPNVLVGEELTCWFPEDQCKLHVLVYGITREDHERLQALAENIYDVADYIERNRIAHSVAHPIYRQNEKLERWHVERLILLFKGFECLNGAHSSLHRDAFEPLLNRLTRQEIQRLAETHGLLPKWPEPWFKARTAGSDDHGLLNVGRTYTLFPPECQTVEDILTALRTGSCQPGGEAGSSAKLAHTFYSVAVRYYSRHVMSPGQTPNLATTILQTMAGETPKPSKAKLAGLIFKSKCRKYARRCLHPFTWRQRERGQGTGQLKKLFIDSAKKHFREHPQLFEVLDRGLPPLGEHQEIYQFVSQINRDVARGLADGIQRNIDEASFTGLFDTIGAILAHQFVLLPYYFAVFHQNKERHLLHEITRQHKPRDAGNLRVGLFTDTFDEVNGVGRFIRDMADQAQRQARHLVVHTSCESPKFEHPIRKNFAPLLSREMPYYPELRLSLPPVLDILEWADRQQFDAIHVSTPGPMGLCGWLASKMLRVPLLATYHTDFPAYVENLTRDYRMVHGTVAYMKWLYGQTSAVFSRSQQYLFNLRDLGLPDSHLRTIQPGINTEKFNPVHRDVNVLSEHGITRPRKLLYCGRVSVEKNLPLLADAFKRLCDLRDDTALVVAGDGPYLAKMKQELEGRPAYFLGYQNDQQLGPLYASCDLFVFPSRTDTLGQVVMEAQASGLPALVSDTGGPKEMVDDGLTGLVLPAVEPSVWTDAINGLLEDEPRRTRMARMAPQRSQRFSLARTFEAFWDEHVLAVEPPDQETLSVPRLPTSPVPA